MAELVRACQREDLPAIAGMFTRVLLKRKQRPPAELARYFEDVIFAGETRGEPRSRVFVDADGKVSGFIGIWRRDMLLDGRSVEAAAAGSLMVEHAERHPTAGARLLRSFLSGPQELSFSETANDISQRMWEKVGGERLPTISLDWLRVLRPAGFAAFIARNAFSAARPLRSVAAGIDRLLERGGRNSLLPSSPTGTFRDAEASNAEIGALIRELSKSYGLYPDWQSPDLDLLLAHAEHKERYGELHRRIVHSARGEPVGCYLYHGRRGELARVLQILSLPGTAGLALDSLFQHATEVGCVGVRGRVAPDLLDALIARRCLLFHASAMMVHARNRSLLAEVRNSRALLTGLAGESWSRLIGGEFA